MIRTVCFRVVLIALVCVSPATAQQPSSLPAPAVVRVEAGDAMATLSWSKVAGAHGYRVYVSTASEDVETLVGSTNTTVAAVQALSNDVDYRFRVAAYAGDIVGPSSDAVNATPRSTNRDTSPVPGAGMMIEASPATAVDAPPPAVPVVPAGVQPPSAAPVFVAPVSAPHAATSAAVEQLPVSTASATVVEPPTLADVEAATPAQVSPTTTLERPTLTAQPGNAKVTLSWAAVANATGYKIFRSTTGTFSTSPVGFTSGTSYVSTGVTNGVTYFYTVSAKDAIGEGPQATPVSVTPVAPPPAPTGLSAVPGDKQATLFWTAAPGASAYTVYRGTTSKQQTLLTSGITAPAFVDSTVINGPTYFYKVTATNAGGESAMSAEASASPTGPAAGLNPALSAAHRLLRQATWGARPGDAEALRTMGAEAFVNAQLAAAPSAYPDILFTLGTDVVQNHWVLTALTGTDQLRQRVAFALHKIWVVSGVEVNNSTALVTYHRLLSQHAFGNYRELMERVTLNPAMGRYLNMLNSRSVQVSNVPANENYARELLQLFTLGTSRLSRDGVAYVRPPKQALVASEFPVAPPEDPIKASEVPTYTEADVKELARILTGWTFGDGNPATIPTRAGSTNYAVEMEPVAGFHDAGAKRFLGVAFPAGQSARADLEQALDAIFNHSNLAPFISRQLIQQLVTSNPSADYVSSIARVFADNGQGVRGDLAAVIKAILLHPEAQQGVADFGKLSEPLLFAISQLRALGATVTNPRFLVEWSSNMGQRVLFPPSVFSYFSPSYRVRGQIGANGRPLVGPEFQQLTTATAPTRVNFTAAVLGDWFASSMTLDLSPFTSRADDPAVLVDYASELFMGTRMSLDMRSAIIKAVRVTAATNPLERVRTAIYLTVVAAQQQVD